MFQSWTGGGRGRGLVFLKCLRPENCILGRTTAGRWGLGSPREIKLLLNEVRVELQRGFGGAKLPSSLKKKIAERVHRLHHVSFQKCTHCCLSNAPEPLKCFRGVDITHGVVITLI